MLFQKKSQGLGKRRKHKGEPWRLFLAFCAMLACVWAPSGVAEAAGRLTYGSGEYTPAINGEFPVGVYVSADEPIASYEAVLTYDPSRLSYVSGGELLEEGRLRIRGGGGASSYKTMLAFSTRLMGDTELSVERLQMYRDEEEREPIAVEEVPPVRISVPSLEGNRLSALQVDNKTVEGFSPERGSYQLHVAYDVREPSVTATAATAGARVTISDTTLSVGENRIFVDVSYQGQTMRYTLDVIREEETASVMAQAEPGGESAETGEGQTQEGGAHLRWSQMSGAQKLLLCALIVLAVGAVVLAVMALQEARRRKRRRERRRQWERKHQLGSKAGAWGKDTSTPGKQSEEEGTAEPKTVISVQDVCMYFKIAQDGSDSLKEFLIRTLTGKNQFRELKALEHVSFDVKQGEVVGIIGTNGSGKSTLLKIVSGALSPTKGKVQVDRRKVQLLTLGTGFDMELTARENVYLNGSLIGYTREYIDEKYEDIVSFAELEGFMDERMKNFSSGMVSRLGFAIATMRDTPEILILDEVLSVGDMFFQKKSLARVKEMMHGGSTVLIVSHSAGVIRQNCTRAVWIEKGILKADGDPKTVCALYEEAGKEAAEEKRG